MNQTQLTEVLKKLITTHENEVIEFKEAKQHYDFNKLGKYFSALSNEANLKGKEFAWLVFGIEDKKHSVVGTDFRKERKDLDSLKKEIADKTTNGISFVEIYEVTLEHKRVLMFQIPASPKGIPIAFDGHYYGRDGEAQTALNIEKIERIRNQAVLFDWSAQIVPTASLDDLDPTAIEIAKRNYKTKFPDKANEVDNWDDITFLNKAKVCIKGKLTNTAILLLGREESEHFISPAEAKIRWILKDHFGVEKDYVVETCPMLLAVDKIYSKIRNLKYRYIKEGTLFPDEVLTYEPYVIREALNNCIAHQDYSKGGRINVVETDDQLIFTNAGSFIPESVEKVVIDNAPEEYYRNKFLVTAMFNLNMVDTVGSGIRKMFNYQKERYFPMPDYDLSDRKVKVTITGKVLDIDYARLLARNKDLSLDDIILLDKVQKKKSLTEIEEKHLRHKKLIEGRKPNYFISLGVAQKIGEKARYTKNRAFNKKYYQDLILNAIKQHGSIERKDIDELLWEKLSDVLNDRQKKIKINNLLQELRRKNEIINNGSDSKPIWKLRATS